MEKSFPPSTRKKVVLRKLDTALVKGYVNSDSYLASGDVEILDREGHLVRVPLDDVKGVYFVREFEGNPARPERKVFQSRPKLDGLWIRLTFKDQEVLEGLLENNLLDLSPEGFHVTPADLASNNTRIFVPRTALATVEVLGVITNGSIRRATRRPTPSRSLTSPAQFGLFPSTGTSTPR